MTPLANVAKNRFFYFIDKISKLLEEARASENVADYIYINDMRTPLFMLEGLCRIYKKIYRHSGFKKLNVHFKELEDKLGGIDYYDGFYKQFQNIENIPVAIALYPKEKRDEEIQSLNIFLKKKKWIGNHQKAISKILNKLENVKWMSEKEDAAAVLKVYENQINKIIKKYKIRSQPFTDIESNVHELRRNLRWLSIYPQSLQGLIQLEVGEDPADFLKKYLTPEIINSPYNKMPDGTGLEAQIYLRQNYYFALSWMIAELGKLKDSGLKIELLEECISSIYKTKENVSALAHSICENKEPTITTILQDSQRISDTFFGENNLKHLVAGLKEL